MIRAPQTRQKRGGAAVVEFTFILAFVLVPLLLGLWEVGRMVEAQQLLDNAVREASRQATTGRKTGLQVREAVAQYMASNNITVNPNTEVTFVNVTDPGRTDPAPGAATSTSNVRQMDHLRVSVTIPVDRIRWAITPRITSRPTLTATANWYSMNDVPLTVSDVIPSAPITGP